jgi:cell division protein FtsI (penicillin-binding protein 3)
VGTSLAVHARYKDDPMRYIRHLERFGLTEPANRQMQGEPAPVVHRPGDESWTPVMLPSMSIGYSISITPLQMAAFYNAIANNGIYLRPYIVESIRDRSQVVRSYGPERREQPICTPSSVMAVKELMRAVVDYGTAKNIRSAKFNIAGKTGTARKAVNGEYRTIYQSSFAGFFPAEAPKYTIYVLIDEPSAGRIYGADVAAPVFRDIAESIWAMDWDLSRQPQRKDSIPDPRPAPRMMYARHAKAFYPSLGIASAGVPNEDWVRPSYNGHQIMYTPVCPEDKGTIPDVKGMSARDAIFLLENLGCRVRVVGRGRVVRQSLLPGYRVAEGGSNITVFLEE